MKQLFIILFCFFSFALADDNGSAEAEAIKLTQEQEALAADLKKDSQILLAVQSAEAAVKKAETAETKFSTSLNNLEDENQGFTTGEPFDTWRQEIHQSLLTANEALKATIDAKDTSTAFDTAEAASIAANQGEQTANEVTDFVTRFQNTFTFDFEESLISATTKVVFKESPTSDQIQSQFQFECRDLLEKFNFNSVLSPRRISPIIACKDFSSDQQYHRECLCGYALYGGDMPYHFYEKG